MTDTFTTSALVAKLTNEGIHIDVLGGDGRQSITIEPSDLEGADFISLEKVSEHCQQDHCGDPDCSCPPALDFGAEAVLVVERWHNQRHVGVFRFCIEDPCVGFVRAVQEAR